MPKDKVYLNVKDIFFFFTLSVSIVFLFTAESLKSIAHFNTIFLILLCCLSLGLVLLREDIPFLASSSSQKKTLTQSKWRSLWEEKKILWLLTLLFYLAPFSPLPFYLVDDMIRHVHDGYYLLLGVDVYGIAPAKLGLVLKQAPNHPHLPTIYFPFTQAQAMLGSLFSVSHGFRILYVSVCTILVWGIYGLASDKERIFYLSIFFSPAFLIFLYSHHADVEGFLLVSFIGLWLKQNYDHSPLAIKKDLI